jgi:hypothetical protein
MLADHIDVVEGALAHGKIVASPALPGLRLPSSWRFSAMAALIVVARMTSLSSMPRQRNFDSVVTWSKAGPSMHSV